MSVCLFSAGMDGGNEGIALELLASSRLVSFPLFSYPFLFYSLVQGKVGLFALSPHRRHFSQGLS